MRKRLTLYIADAPVDLDDQSFILFNYTMEDLSNPTVVKNSYTQQITLKGTPNNNRIFGEAFRLDRYTDPEASGTGADFNPSKKTPFAIYNDLGEILESGYVKLDNIVRSDVDVRYKVTLYGGLGSFLYSLSYDEEGNRRTLADLDYPGLGDDELTFNITAENVRAAWGALSSSGSGKWRVINFAPAYNGIPDSNFSADKAIARPGDVGLPIAVTQDDKRYATRSGYSLLSLSEAHDEWSVKDLRSYLQRPVLSVKALLDAISDPSNNGGFPVYKQDVEASDYGNLWMTLPMLPSLKVSDTAVMEYALALSSSLTNSMRVGEYRPNVAFPAGAEVSASFRFYLDELLPASASSVSSVSLQSRDQEDTLSSIIFIQVVAVSSSGAVVGGSRVKVLNPVSGQSSAQVAQLVGFTPWYSESGTDMYLASESASFQKVGQSGGSYIFRYGDSIALDVTAENAASFRVMVSAYYYNEYSDRPVSQGGGTGPTPTLYAYPSAFIASAARITGVAAEVDVAVSDIRSGATITKEMLLSTSGTPADYLLSFCKQFGFCLLYDSAAKSVSIVSRNTLYQDEVIDISERIDRGREMSVKPLSFDAKWYEFMTESVGGAFEEEYRSLHGISYGIQRVNTGYDFNAETKDLLPSSVMKSAASILGRSKYYNIITYSGIKAPSVFIDPGNKYTLWTPDGDSAEFDIPQIPYGASVRYWNSEGFRGYDYEGGVKPEFRDAGGKGLDGQNVFLFFDGFVNYADFKMTDDLAEMDLFNDGVPCWILTGTTSGLDVPMFRTYRMSGNIITDSLDFGRPKELAIPDAAIAANTTVYEKAWRRYLLDRYDVNTKVVTCRVHMDGMQVSAGLLRRFYWFDNALWVLNAIRNYSLTTYDPVECEFVQVQDKENYINGQLF